MSVIPIISSAADLPGAIKHAQRHPSSRWYVAKLAHTYGESERIPVEWGITAAFGGDWSGPARKKAAGKGQAMPGGSFPIKDEADLRRAIKAYGRAKDKAAAKKHIISRAKSLGKTSLLPASWKPISASGTSSLTPSHEQSTIEGMEETALTAAGWDPNLHPRDRRGRFIEKFDILNVFSVADGTDVAYRGTAVGSYKGADGKDHIQVKRDDADGGGILDVTVDKIESAPPAKAHLNGTETPSTDATPPVSPEADGVSLQTKKPEEVAVGDTIVEPRLFGPHKGEDQHLEVTEVAPPKSDGTVNLAVHDVDSGADYDMSLMAGRDVHVRPGGGETTWTLPEDGFQYEGAPDDYELAVSEAINNSDPDLYDILDAAELNEKAAAGFEARRDPAEVANEIVAAHKAGSGGNGVDQSVPEGIDPDAWRVANDYSLDGLDPNGEDAAYFDNIADAEGVNRDDLVKAAQAIRDYGGTSPMEGLPNPAEHDAELEKAKADPEYATAVAIDNSDGAMTEIPPTSQIADQLSANYPKGLPRDDDGSVDVFAITEDLDIPLDGDDNQAMDVLLSRVDNAVNQTLQGEAAPGSDSPSAPTSDMIGSDGVLSIEARDALQPLAELLDVDHGVGSAFSGMSEMQFEPLVNYLDDYYQDPEAVPDWARESLDKISEWAKERDLDDADVIDTRLRALQLGWAQEEQLRNVLAGESIDEQNSNAMGNVAEFLRTTNISDRSLDPEDPEAPTMRDLGDAIASRTPGAPGWGGEPTADQPDYTAPPAPEAPAAPEASSTDSADWSVAQYNEERDAFVKQYLADHPEIGKSKLAHIEATNAFHAGPAKGFVDKNFVKSTPAPAQAPAAPEPSGGGDDAAAKTLRLMSKSAGKASTALTPADVDDRLGAILAGDDPKAAHQSMAKLMTELKLGGKQRKRYREALDKYFGVGGDDSAKTEAAATAESLSPDNPVKERLAKRALQIKGDFKPSGPPPGKMSLTPDKGPHVGWKLKDRVTLGDQAGVNAGKQGTVVSIVNDGKYLKVDTDDGHRVELPAAAFTKSNAPEATPFEKGAPLKTEAGQAIAEQVRRALAVGTMPDVVVQLSEAQKAVEAGDNDTAKKRLRAAATKIDNRLKKGSTGLPKGVSDTLKQMAKDLPTTPAPSTPVPEKQALRDRVKPAAATVSKPVPLSQAPQDIQDYAAEQDSRDWGSSGNPYRKYNYLKIANPDGAWDGPITTKPGVSNGFGPSVDAGDSPWAGTRTVQHGYFGSSTTMPDGRQVVMEVGGYDGGTGRGTFIDGLSRWTVEFAGDEANAQRIWAHRAEISKIVKKHGGSARVAVDFNPDGTMTVREYDYDKWSETVPIDAGKA